MQLDERTSLEDADRDISMENFSRTISACGAVSVLPSDDAQDYLEFNSDFFNPRKEVYEIKDILTDLSKIQYIYKFDSDILNQKGAQSVTGKLKEHKELEDFYSPEESTRKTAFTRSIKDPLLRVLCKFGDVCSKLSGKAKHIAIFSILNESEVKVKNNVCCLLEVAIQEIFSHQDNGLSALEHALKVLQENPKNIDDAVLERLKLYRSMVGFFYDQKAAQNLIELSTFIPESDPSEVTVRLAMLMFLQMAGEYFDRLLDGALFLGSYITHTAKARLRDLRSVLSRLSKSKLEKVLSADAEKTFKDAGLDIKILTTDLQKISHKYAKLLDENKGNPEKLWSQWKTPSKIEDNGKGASHAQALWDGINGISKFFQQSKNMVEEVDHKLSDAVFPASLDIVLVEDYVLYRKKLNDVLKTAVPSQKSTMEIFEKLSEDGRDELWKHIEKLGKSLFVKFFKTEVQGVTTLCPWKDEHYDSYWKKIKSGEKESFFEKLEQDGEKLRSTSKQLLLKKLTLAARGASAKSLLTEKWCNDLWERIRKQRKEKAETDVSQLLEPFVDELLHVSSGNHKKIEERRKNLLQTQTEFKALFQQQQQKACHGNGNISLQYKEFLENLKANGVTNLEEPPEFSWTSEPASNLEKLFHKVHKTGIFTRAGKDALRSTVIERKLRAIDYLRTKFNIKTSIDSEVQKECFKTIFSVKEQHMEKAIELLKKNGEQSDTKQLCTIGNEFVVTAKKIKSMDPIDDVHELVDLASNTLKKFEETWTTSANKGSSVFPVDLMNNLKVTEADKYFLNSAVRTEVEAVKNDHRNHPTIAIVTDELRRTFQAYNESMRDALKEYKKLLADDFQLHRNSNTGQQINEKEDVIQKKVETKIEALSASEDAQRFFERAKEIQNAKSELSSDPVSVSSKWKKFMLTLTRIYQQYQATLLAHKFFVATGYEMLKEICDYPELKCLENAILVRHAIFHNNNPFAERPWEVIGLEIGDLSIPDTLEGHVAKEISILTVGVSCVLTTLAESLK